MRRAAHPLLLVALSTPDDPGQRDAALRAVNLLTQPATQVVVKTAWKP
jgi:hypothetical protein